MRGVRTGVGLGVLSGVRTGVACGFGRGVLSGVGSTKGPGSTTTCVGETEGVGVTVGVIVGSGVIVGVGEEDVFMFDTLPPRVIIQSPTAPPDPIARNPRITASNTQSALDFFFCTGKGRTSRTSCASVFLLSTGVSSASRATGDSVPKSITGRAVSCGANAVGGEDNFSVGRIRTSGGLSTRSIFGTSSGRSLAVCACINNRSRRLCSSSTRKFPSADLPDSL